MKISKFNVNRSKSNLSFKSVSYISDGLMTSDDYINLHSIENMSDKNIEQINITGPDMSEINPKFEEAQQKLSEQNDKLKHLYYLTESQGYCGRVWDESSASPTAKTYCGNLEMLQNLPELLGLGGYLVQNDHTRRKLSKENHYFFEDGTEAKLDGSMGHYQWGWNHPFYITTWNENNLFYECISFEPIKGRESYYIPVGSMSASGFATVDRETNTLVSYCNTDSRYRGGNDNTYCKSLDNNPEKSLLGRCCANMKYTQYITYAHKNGQGWYAGTMRMHSVMTILFHIIMGTRNSQADFNPIKNKDGLYECGLGYGCTGTFNNSYDNGTKYNTNYPYLSMSEGAELGDYLGYTYSREITYTDTKKNNNIITERFQIPIFYGLKHPYGYMIIMTEDSFVRRDIQTNTITHYIKKSMYETDYDYIAALVNDKVITGSTVTLNRNQYITDVSYKHLELFPTKNTGSKETYYSDVIDFLDYEKMPVYYNSASCNLLVNGIHTLIIIYEFGTTSSVFGSPLCEFTEDFLLDPIIS